MRGALALGARRGLAVLPARVLARLMMSWAKWASGGTRGRIAIWRTMRRTLESGFGIREALESAIEAAPKSRGRRYMIGRWQHAYADGPQAFAAEVGRWVPASEGLMFGALGQGKAQELFAAAARVAEIRNVQVKAVRSALLWPGVILLATLGVVWWAAAELLPRFRGFSDPEKWTTIAKIGYAVSRGVYQFDLALAIALPALLAGLWIAVLRWTGPGRRWLDDYAPFSFYRVISGTAFLLMVLELMKAGVDLNEAMWRRLGQRASPYVRSRMEAIQERMVHGGMGFGRAMSAAGTGFPDYEVVAMAAALDGREGWHEEMGGFLDLWARDSEDAIRAVAMALTVAMMVACGLLTALVMSPAMQSFIHLNQIRG